eukprot:COSAG04_NODE_4765_length_1904_cov_1.177285_2_plen_203_part_00
MATPRNSAAAKVAEKMAQEQSGQPEGKKQAEQEQEQAQEQEQEQAEPAPRGILCTLTAWKAALLGPFVDCAGLGAVIPLLPFFLQDLESCTASDETTACNLSAAIAAPGAAVTDALVNGTCAVATGSGECDYQEPGDPAFIGIILSAQYFGVVVGSIFWGRLSDFLGVRRIYVVLLILDAVLFTLSAVSTSPLFLAIMRGLA